MFKPFKFCPCRQKGRHYLRSLLSRGRILALIEVGRGLEKNTHPTFLSWRGAQPNATVWSTSLSRDCLERGPSAPNSEMLCRLLQRGQNASIPVQGYADRSSDSADRRHNFTRSPWRTSLPILPSLRSGHHAATDQIAAAVVVVVVVVRIRIVSALIEPKAISSKPTSTKSSSEATATEAP
jgi:hypothetical protein